MTCVRHGAGTLGWGLLLWLGIAVTGATGQSDVSRLPPVDVQPASYNAATSRTSAEAESAARIEELEARLAELEARLPSLSEQGAANEESGVVVGSDLDLKPKWNHGLELQSANKDFRVHVGGRTQVDTTWYTDEGDVERSIDDGGLGPISEATNLRRGRLRIDGVMYEVIEFACEYDFVNEADVNPNPSLVPPQGNPDAIPAVTDLWVAINHLPVVGTVKVGVIKDPFLFEHLTSSRYLNFIERSFLQDTFAGPFNNGFIPGVLVTNTAFDEHMTLSIGQFKNVNNIFANGIGDGEIETCGRLTWLPWLQDEGRYLVHVGIAGKYMGLDEEQIRFRSRGNLRSGAPSSFNPVFANTGNMLGDQEQQLGLELVSVWGPWSFASEWVGAWVNDAFTLPGQPTGAGFQPPPGTSLGTYFAEGAYVEALYFLTGEHRAYNRKTGAFDRVIPHENFFLVKTPYGPCGGWGAWQVGARYGWLDLNDSGLNGGRLNSLTLGINWFLNPNLKFQANYDVTHREFANVRGLDGSGEVHGFGMRCAFDF
jgi:phosphate-selective porin OprO/OprP